MRRQYIKHHFELEKVSVLQLSYQAPSTSNMKFLIIAALVAVAAAEYAAYKPAYKAEYAAPAYSAPAYKAPAYETYAPLPYSFAYDVNDEYYNNMGHKETSDGNGYVSGSYHVALPDGRVQTVTYKADGYNGYVADVSYSGYAKEYVAPAYKAPAYSAPAYSAPAYTAPAYPAY